MELNSDEKTENVDIVKFDWTPEHEKILIEWADKAMCYRWLHTKSYIMFSSLNAWYTIPVIVISTLTGTANFAQQRVPIDFQVYFSMIVGAFNILAGIITTIQQFLKITQLSESHRVSSIAWDKFYRNIKIELAKHPLERADPSHMLKINKEEFDRLMETSPNIPEGIIQNFKNNFNTAATFELIVKPEICDILIPTNEYRNPWNNEENRLKNFNNSFSLKLEKQNAIKKINEINNKQITDFISLFNISNSREPLDSEILDNLKDKIDVNIITKFIEERKFINKNNIDDIFL